MPVVLGHRFDEALQFASAAHRQQIRKGRQTPYIGHPLAVASLVIEFGGDEDQAIAALLHDLLEDQADQFGGSDAAKQVLRERFGEQVQRIVIACSDHHASGPRPDWRSRKQYYLDQIAAKPEVALLVIGCDKLHNASCILRDYREVGEDLWRRFAGGRDGSLWYYRALVSALAGAGLQASPLAELARVVAQIEALAAGQPAAPNVPELNTRPF
jgi:(p)ppGpp synthase/HD superfamily hydrolase